MMERKIDKIFSGGFLLCHLIMIFKMEAFEHVSYYIIMTLFAVAGYFLLFRLIFTKK